MEMDDHAYSKAKPLNCYWLNSLQWRHNERDGVWNHQPHDCLLNRLFRRRSKKTSKLHVTVLCVCVCVGGGGPVNPPHKGIITRKMLPFDDVIMCARLLVEYLMHEGYHWTDSAMKKNDRAWANIFRILGLTYLKYNTCIYQNLSNLFGIQKSCKTLVRVRAALHV